jgi:hypothetical protein
VGAGTAAVLLADDPPTAGPLSVEILAVGHEGILLQHEAIDSLAAQLRGPRTTSEPQQPDAAWKTVAAMEALVGRRVAEGETLAPAVLEALCVPL